MSGFGIKKFLKWTLMLVVSLVVLFLFVAGPLFVSAAVVNGRFQFPDPLLGRTPSDLGMSYQDIVFSSAPDVTLRGWYVPGQAGRTAVVFCHGLNRARVEMLPQAQFVHGLGFSSVLFDLRHHGTSGGDKTTLGAREKEDVLAAVRLVRQREPASRILVWGISMGAASAMLAAAADSGIDAVISDSSYRSFRETIDHHLRLFFRLPPWPIAREIRGLMEWRGGFRGDEIDILDATRKMGARPVMFVAQSGDRRVPPTIARELYQTSASPSKRLLILDGRRHGHAYRDHVEEYQKAALEFFKAAGLIENRDLL